MATTWPESTSQKIHRRIILTFILTTVFAILLVGSTLRYVLEKTTMDNWKKRQEFVTLEFVPQCDHEIQEATRDLEFVSRMPAFSNLSHIDQIDPSIKGVPENVEVEKRKMFRNLMALGERFSSIIILRPNGDLYLVHPFKTQLKVTRSNFADRPYFKKVVRTKKPVISDSFVSGAGNPVVVIVVPVLDKAGDITAIIAGGYYLTSLSRLVDKKEIGTFDFGFIVDRKGNLIAHTDTKLLQEGSRSRYTEHALVSRFLHKSPQDSSKVVIEDSVDSLDGKRYLTSFVKLRSGWGLGLALSRETILSEIRPAVWRITILVSFIILIVGATGVFFARWIGRRWIGTEKALIKQTHDLGERIKELNGLYNISRVIEKPDISLEEIFQEIVEIVPHSYQHSEITCSRIVMTDKEYKTTNFKETEWKQSSEIFVTGSQTGTLEVYYLKEQPEVYEGPFLKEERIFIDEIADRLRMITVRKRVGAALRKSEKNYRSMMEAMKDPVHICSQDFRITYMNPVGIERIGFDPTGEYCYKAIHARSKKCPWCVLNKVLRGEYVDDYEVVSELDGHLFLVSNVPIFHADGNISKMAIYKDISEGKSMQDRLIRSERLAATGQLAASVAHEINSPLQAITILLDTLKNKYAGDNELRENFELLEEIYKSITNTVANLLDLNRPGKEQKQNTDVNDIITRTLALLRTYLLKTKININLELSPKIPPILVSPQQLNHVFLNLINNAIEAIVNESSPDKSNEISIISTLRDGNIVIKVSDNGPGLSDKDFHRIFDPFYTTKKQMGLGVGLSVCHDIIEDHGGIIRAENAPKGGAVFTINFPLTSLLDDLEKNNEKT